MKNLTLTTLAALSAAVTLNAQERPNVIIILADDQGYEDLSCFNSPDIETPNIDKIAKQGIKLTNFYVSASISSPSRASLLTGRLNSHNGVPGVYFPDANGGLSPDEVTIAEALKTVGYQTACIGKWHLGDKPQYMPTNQGFDYYYGIPYSNDMYISPHFSFAKEVDLRDGYTLKKAKNDQKLVKTKESGFKKQLKHKCPIVEQENIVEYPCDQSTLTKRYFDRAIEFIDENKEEPFFTYITPAMPHYPISVSKQFDGVSKGGIYGDAIEEIDWNVGRLMDYLDQNDLSKNTIVIYFSDNGPWLNKEEETGSAAPLRDGKFSHYEGGVRVPYVMKWEGRIPANTTSDAISTSIDIFPTIMHYAGVDIASCKNPIDGICVADFWEDPTTAPRDEYLYVRKGKLFGIRKGDWIYLPKSGERKTPKNFEAELFNINDDISQNKNVIKKYPKKAAELRKLMVSYYK